MKCFLNRDYVENFIRYHKKTIIKVAVGFILFSAAFFVFCVREHSVNNDEFNLIDKTDQECQAELPIQEKVTSDSINMEEEQKKNQQKIYIDISGAVEKPYVYEVKEGTRAYEVIELAGGLTEDADISNLNLAQILKDEDKITISTKNQLLNGSEKDAITNTKSTAIINSADNYNQQQNQTGSQGLIDINTAGSDQLQTITGIGPSTAEKIILYRQEHGQFKKIEEIMNVSGIGEKTFAKLKSKITV